MRERNNIDYLFEDFLDSVSAEDLSRKKASDKLNAQEKRLSAWELLDKYDYLFIIRTDILRANDIKEKLVNMNNYLDEVLTMSRCVADFELGLMYIQEDPEKLDKSYRKFGVLDEGTNVVCIEDAKTAELLVGSGLTKSNRMYVTFGANMTPNIKGIIRLLPSFNLRRSETDHSFIMNEISIIKSDSNPLIENNEKELRYLDASHCTDILRDVYSTDTGDHFFQIFSYKEVIRALMFLMPNSKEKIMDVMSTFRPKCHEYYIAQFMKDAQQRYLVNRHPHLKIKSDRKVALKKSVVD